MATIDSAYWKGVANALSEAHDKANIVTKKVDKKDTKWTQGNDDNNNNNNKCQCQNSNVSLQNWQNCKNL